MKGLVLAKIAPGMEASFFGGLGAVPQVRSVYYLFEDYDYVIEVEADSEDELVRILSKDLRGLPGVERAAEYLLGDLVDLSAFVRGSSREAIEGRTIFNPRPGAPPPDE